MQNNLPSECYGVLPAEQHVIRIKNGESGYYTLQNQPPLEDETIEDYVNSLNAANGITKAQRAAMEHGSMFNWDGEMAKAESYDENGKLLPPKLPIRISANEHDFHVTRDWIRRNQEKGNGAFHLPDNGDLYPFLHIETHEPSYHYYLPQCFQILKQYSTVSEAMKHINKLMDVLPIEMVGSGGKHIYFQEAPRLQVAKRVGIIYFDPYL